MPLIYRWQCSVLSLFFSYNEGPQEGEEGDTQQDEGGERQQDEAHRQPRGNNLQ